MDKYYHTKESIDEYINLAKDVNGQQLINKLKVYLPSASSLLELGSGPGTDWRILSKDYKVTGSDNSSEFLEHLTTNNPTGNFLKLDASLLETDQKFDGIYSNKVLHHLSDAELEKSIEQQSNILNSKGIIAHSFWKGTGSEIFKGMFVNYHSSSDLKHHFSPYFDVLVLEEYTEFDAGDSVFIIARKK
jgi:trans-aconitate methyltransferase